MREVKFYKKIYNPFLKNFYTDYVYLWYRDNFFEMVRNTYSKTINCSQAGILFNNKVQWTSLKILYKNFYKWLKFFYKSNSKRRGRSKTRSNGNGTTCINYYQARS